MPFMNNVAVQPDRPQMASGAGAFRAEYLRLQTDTQNMYILIAFLRQQRLHERALMLRYAYISSLVIPLIFTRREF
jgi:hypothetical protein